MEERGKEIHLVLVAPLHQGARAVLRISLRARRAQIHLLADAEAVGIPFPVIDNGNAIAGTELSRLGPEAKNAMDEADIILSKGQGNAETLLGCGYNIYYAFLIKCPRFIQRDNTPKLTPMLVKERS